MGPNRSTASVIRQQAHDHPPVPVVRDPAAGGSMSAQTSEMGRTESEYYGTNITNSQDMKEYSVSRGRQDGGSEVGLSEVSSQRSSRGRSPGEDKVVDRRSSNEQ